MKFMALLALLLTTLMASPTARAAPGYYYPPGFSPGWTPYPSRGPGYFGPGWGRGYPPPAFPPPPQFLPPRQPLPPRYNPPPQAPGLCQGDFSGTLSNGEMLDISLSGSGQNVTAKVTGSEPGDTYVARGTCQESNGVARLTLTIANGASTSAKIYVAGDGTIYLDGSQNGDGIGFLLQKR